MNGDHAVLLDVSARTDLGRARDHNEDAFLVADLTRGTTEFLESGQAKVGPRGSLFLVADGMGGAAAGEIASAMAAETIFDHLRTAWTRGPGDSSEEFTLRIREAVETANDRIHRYAQEHPDSRGMGTTATVAGVFAGRIHLAQVGDSRAYLVRGGRAVQLTKDQSLMQRLIDAGEMTEEQAAQSERRNIILQALGPDARIRVDVTYQDLARGDTLILCSDGLSGQVKRDEMAAIATEATDVRQISERLIALANERGGPDNITAVVVRFGGDLPDDVADELSYRQFPLGDDPNSGERPAAPGTPDVSTPIYEDDPLPARTADVAPPVSRTGSPVVMAAIGVVLLLVLLGLFLVFG